MGMGIYEAKAADHPEAYLGKYGIQHHSTIAAYQQYVGQAVRYLKSGMKSGNYNDKKGFLDNGGSFDMEYVISKISGDDKRMTFTLVEKGGKKKVKMTINNQNEYYSYGKYLYCITENYTVPLLLVDKFNEDKNKCIGKIYPSTPNDRVNFEITDMIMRLQESVDGYPIPMLVLKNKINGETIYYNANSIDDLNDLGTIFTNPKYKFTYIVTNVEMKKSKYYPYKIEKIFTVQNSINGNKKEVLAETAAQSAFKDDDSGKFYATLTKVEKPSNPNIRYGKTTSVTEQDITKYSYTDNFIDILIFTSSSQFNFVLRNVSDNTLKIIWNEAVFVDVDGSTSKIMHAGIKYSEREGDQPASTIIKGAKLEDLAAPTNKVHYSDVLKEWISKSLYSNADRTLANQVIKLMLPIQVKDVVNEYVFEFTLSYKFNYPELLVGM